MKSIFGVLLVLAGLVLGFYIGGWVMFVGGIIQVIQSVTPVIIAEGIAIGLARIFFSSLVGWIAGALLVVPGMVLLDIS